MSSYSDFELKIIAKANKEVNGSPNYKVLSKLKRFMREQIVLAGDTYYKFCKWNNKYNQEKILEKFDDLEKEIIYEYNKLLQSDSGQKTSVLSENDIIDIETLSDKGKAIFYKAKVDFLTREFSESNLLFLRIFLPLTRQMLAMNKRPTDLFDNNAVKLINSLKLRQKARTMSAVMKRERKAQDKKAELKLFEIMYDIMTMERSYLHQLEKHELLIKFCVVSNVIDIEIRKEIERRKKTSTKKTEQILDSLRDLKSQLDTRIKLENISSSFNDVFDKLYTYCDALRINGKHHNLQNALDNLQTKLCGPNEISSIRELGKFDKMLLNYGANDDIAANIYRWLDQDSILRPFVQDMLRRVRQRLKTSRITSTSF